MDLWIQKQAIVFHWRQALQPEGRWLMDPHNRSLELLLFTCEHTSRYESLWLRTYIWHSDGQLVCSAGNGFQTSQRISRVRRELRMISWLLFCSCRTCEQTCTTSWDAMFTEARNWGSLGHSLTHFKRLATDPTVHDEYNQTLLILDPVYLFTSLLKFFEFRSQKHLSFHVLILKKHFFLGMNKPHHLVLYSVCFGSVRHFLLNEPFESAWSVQE